MHPPLRLLQRVLGFVLFCSLSTATSSAGTSLFSFENNSSNDQPNIILINLDDADSEMLVRPEILRHYPNINQLANSGLRFTNFHVTTPLCTPSRCSLLRGQYAHQTNQRVNGSQTFRSNGYHGGFKTYREAGFFEDDLSIWMQELGYRTMLVGKFIHPDVEVMVPPGWDDFHSSAGDLYFGAVRITNQDSAQGRLQKTATNEYRTRVEWQDVNRLIRTHKRLRPTTPFFLYFNPLAPHLDNRRELLGMSEPKYASWWWHSRVPRTLDFSPEDLTGQYPFERLLQYNPQSHITNFVDNLYRERLRSVRTVDDIIGSLRELLSELELESNTYIMLTSDNGYVLGHHRYFGKSVPLDRISRVPFLVTGPGVPAGNADHLLAHIDIAPTLVDLANGEPREFVNGRSFKPLLREPTVVDEKDWRNSILIETFNSPKVLGNPNQLFLAASSTIRYFDSVYTEWAQGSKAYFDLATDPFQLNNLYDTLSSTEKQLLALELRSKRTDSIPPIINITSPFVAGATVDRSFRLRGIAEDDFSVSRVRVAIQDLANGSFWDGSRWQDEFVQVPAELTNEGGIQTHWRYELSFQGPDSPTGDLHIRAWAVDADRNLRPPSSTTLKVDTVPPQVLITSPESMTGFGDGAVEFQGSVHDKRPTQVRVIVRDVATNRFWNGRDFQSVWTYLAADVDNDRWSLNAELPPGRYAVSVRAVDSSRNVSDASPVVRITVDR